MLFQNENVNFFINKCKKKIYIYITFWCLYGTFTQVTEVTVNGKCYRFMDTVFFVDRRERSKPHSVRNQQPVYTINHEFYI